MRTKYPYVHVGFDSLKCKSGYVLDKLIKVELCFKCNFAENKSYVASSSSWFIETTLDVFKRPLQEEACGGNDDTCQFGDCK